MQRRSSVFVLGLCALGATLTSASARGGPSELPPVSVSDPHSELRPSATARLLHARLQQAADRVCPAAPRYELARYAVYQRCMTAALSAAVQAIEKQRSGAPPRAVSPNVSGVAALVTPCAAPTRL